MTPHKKFHQICTLIGSFCRKYRKIQLRKYRGVMSYDTKEWYNIWEKTNLLFQKWQEFGEFWPKHSIYSKICTLIGSFCEKHITFDLKKYRVILNDTKKWCKIWRKTDLWFGNWLEQFWKLSPEHFESIRIGTLMGFFYPK